MAVRKPISTEQARNLFLCHVRSIKPQVLDHLSGEPYRCFKETILCFEGDDGRLDYRNAVARHIWAKYQRPAWEVLEVDSASLTDARIAVLRESLFDWSREHNLDVAWCRKRAYDTLDYWSYSPRAHQERRWEFEMFGRWDAPSLDYDERRQKTDWAYQSPPIDEPQSFFYQPQIRFDTSGEMQIDLEDFKRQAKAYADYLNGLKRQYRETRLDAMHSDHRPDHYEWAVWFQVVGKGYEEIFKQYYPQEYANLESQSHGIGQSSFRVCLAERTQRIRKAVHQVASLIGLPLDEVRTAPGRRPSANS
ncbi:MAG TPA: hypothetical protein VNN73_19110 [Blastocatellia bacterium]|nr:hypothetical protein [Blastocatellia bacterium]